MYISLSKIKLQASSFVFVKYFLKMKGPNLPSLCIQWSATQNSNNASWKCLVVPVGATKAARAAPT